jgi:cytoskeleton protein RodZ
LAEIRRKRELSVESVAASLHLRADVVRAIEGGDESRLPSMAFIRGYIKSYARLLGVDDRGLVAELPAATAHRSEPLKTVGMRRPGLRLPLGKWLSWLLAFGAALWLIAYGMPLLERLWSQGGEEPRPNQLELPRVLPDDTAFPLEPPAAEPRPPETPATAAQPGTGSAPAPVPEAEPGPGREAGPAEQPVVEAPVAEPEAPVADSGAAPLLELRFEQDSWLEVEAGDKKLVIGIQRAGTERSLRAEPPVSLLIGNAPGVSVSYRGEAVDLTPHQRGNVARLTLED